MRRKLFQYKSFYIRFDTPDYKMRDDILLGFLSCGGIYKACTDMSLTTCKTFVFEEFKIGLILFGIAFGIEKEIEETNNKSTCPQI